MSEETNEEQQSGEIALPIEWHYPEGIQSRYANNVLVQASRLEFTLSFFEMQLPALFGTPEENLAKLKEAGKVRAECISKVIISPELVQKFINSLQTELDKFSANRESLQGKA